MQDRAELKALVDFYATESDKNNQDCYVEIFRRQAGYAGPRRA